MHKKNNRDIFQMDFFSLTLSVSRLSDDEDLILFALASVASFTSTPISSDSHLGGLCDMNMYVC